jgi:glucose/mannose transport system substrate-binding protein
MKKLLPLLSIVLILVSIMAVSAQEGDQVEVFSWWTGGGEAQGLEAMIEVFSAQNPDIEFINATVAGGAGTNARAVLATRLQAGDSPDSWQGHAGQELIGTYVAANQLEGLNWLYEQEGWLDVMPETLIPLISKDGEIYSVPVNIHRANMIWYSPSVLENAGITEVPDTMEGFIEALQTLKDAGVEVPLVLGEQWTALHLFETILLGSMTPEQYNGLWDGTTAWSDPVVTKALENYDKVLSYTNPDAASLTWQDASAMLFDDAGTGAFHVNGDWAEGYFRELGKEPLVDYGWAPVPGTGGTFQFLSDSFVLSANAPHREAAIEWLKICGSKEGQDAFNPIKGSIPARSDGDVELYGVYLQDAMKDWASNVVVGSLTHGVTANDSWKSEIDTALGLFLGMRDVQSFQDSLVYACESYGPCE